MQNAKGCVIILPDLILMFKIECRKALNRHIKALNTRTRRRARHVQAHGAILRLFAARGYGMNFKPVEEIKNFMQAIAAPMGIEVVDVETKGENLTVFIETEAGVDLDTCERFHNAIMDPIDELDPSYGAAYTLNVSSPGLDRPFKTERDFQRNLGKEVEVKLYAPLKGKKFLQGVLAAFDAGSVTLDIGGTEEKINRTKIAKINKAINFD